MHSAILSIPLTSQVSVLNKAQIRVMLQTIIALGQFTGHSHLALGFGKIAKGGVKVQIAHPAHPFSKSEPIMHQHTPHMCLGLNNLVELCKNYATTFDDS